MNFYWVYDIPNWEFALLTVGTFIIVAIGGLFAFRRVVQRNEIPQSHNDIVSFYMAGLTAIYGITLGLIAIGAWQNLSDVDANVSKEASTIAAVLQDIKFIPEPYGDSLKAQLKEYTRYTIEDSWPQQRQGIVPHGGTSRLSLFQTALSKYEPKTKNQEIVLAEIYKQFNIIIELRRIRLINVTNGLPSTIWGVIIFGSLINIIITWFFITDKFSTHLVMTALYAALLGSLVFLVGAMDNPFRGEFSIGPDAFESVYQNMK